MFILCEVEMETSPRISLLGWPGGLVAGLARPAVPARVLSANSNKRVARQFVHQRQHERGSSAFYLSSVQHNSMR
jgi:hypothetical protein